MPGHIYLLIHRGLDNMGTRPHVDIVMPVLNKEDIADYLDGEQGWELRIVKSGEQVEV